MIGLDVNDVAIVKQTQVLEDALSTNPKTQNALRKLIRIAIMDARSQVVSAASSSMKSDPRGAANAIRTTVYRKILGANINIYNSRKAHGSTSYEPPRKGVSGRGGNRLPRSGRTAKIMGYEALDRGFILRWINEGAGENGRSITFKSDERRGRWPSVPKWSKNPNTGNRGSIAAHNFFRGAGDRALVQAADNLANMIDDELETMLNKNK